MKQIDLRFSASDMAEIENMIGKKMIKYKCDPFEFSTSVYGIVGIIFEHSAYVFTNRVKVLDYYGSLEEVAVFKMSRIPSTDIYSMVKSQTMIENPIESKISDIFIVNEKQQLFEKGEQTYEVQITRGIIFKFEDNHELSFEKSIWFSEDIIVEKGYDLIHRFAPTSEFEEGWSGDLQGTCSREILSLK